MSQTRMELTGPYPHVTSWQETCLNPRYPDIPKTDMGGKAATQPGACRQTGSQAYRKYCVSSWDVEKHKPQCRNVLFFNDVVRLVKSTHWVRELRFGKISIQVNKLIVWELKLVHVEDKYRRVLRAALASTFLRALITRCSQTNGTDAELVSF